MKNLIFTLLTTLLLIGCNKTYSTDELISRAQAVSKIENE